MCRQKVKVAVGQSILSLQHIVRFVSIEATSVSFDAFQNCVNVLGFTPC